MITPADIEARARQQYPRLLRAWLTGELDACFPLLVPGNKGSLTDDPALRTQQLRRLRDGSCEGRGFGYVVQWQTVRSARHGEQGVPSRIVVEDLPNYLRLCNLKGDFTLFTEQATLIRQQLPALADWLTRYPEKVTPQAGHWPALLRVCAFFQQHPLPNVYARQVPGVPSKFVEQHTGILTSLLATLLSPDQQRPDTDFTTRFGLRADPPPVRFRLLDAQLAAQFSGLTDLTVPQPDFEALGLPPAFPLRVLVVENKLTFLMLPSLPATLAVWGSGYAVERLRHCNWLHRYPLYYWGDADLHGFHILAQMRGYFPHTTSVLMDTATYQQHQEHAHAGSIPPPSVTQQLTPRENDLYQLLLGVPTHNRLEQEHIASAYALSVLKEYIS